VTRNLKGGKNTQKKPKRNRKKIQDIHGLDQKDLEWKSSLKKERGEGFLKRTSGRKGESNIKKGEPSTGTLQKGKGSKRGD